MKNHGGKLKIWETAALLALSLSLCAGAWAQGRQNSISGNLVRLHVIAASDEPAEQELKLRVRDEVLRYLGPALQGAKSAEEAREIIGASLEKIAGAAEKVSEGRSVAVSLSRERYPTRRYQGFTLPAGCYESLRVVLGEGEGKNWWCVVFPPLCLSAAGAEQAEKAMSREDFAIVTESEGYELRFRLVELWGELSAALQGK